jgi:hypothetical protein
VIPPSFGSSSSIGRALSCFSANPAAVVSASTPPSTAAIRARLIQPSYDQQLVRGPEVPSVGREIIAAVPRISEFYGIVIEM